MDNNCNVNVMLNLLDQLFANVNFICFMTQADGKGKWCAQVERFCQEHCAL